MRVYANAEAAAPSTFVAATTASAQATAVNYGRRALFIANDAPSAGTIRVYVALATTSDVPAAPQVVAPTAVVGSGILLLPGESIFLEGYQGASSVIATATCNVCVQEL